ncbi:hypothetical protein [Cyanothece sp. BG0011]|uniref:hypothetical protein n=1 Tax=Cyanothece sp. BG0011 TaxID=2082950 RepID=UPI000D1DD4F2|nr:hypothetical protein [Cyanothece sp. BG0011]
MKKILTLALISCFTFPIFNFKSVNAQSSCQATINSVVSDIKSKGVRTVLTEERKVPEYYTENPTNKNTEFWLTMGPYNSPNSDRRTRGIIANIMNSKVLMKTYSDKIVASCSKYGVVSIGAEGTDWVEQYALQPNGKTTLRTCVSPGPGVQLTWNQVGCL